MSKDNALSPKQHFVLKQTVSVWWKPKFDRYSQELMDIIRPQERGFYLEVCVGDGRYTVPMATSGNLMVGVDLSREMLEMCSNNLKKKNLQDSVSLVQADAENLPFKKDVFDKTVCISSLAHIPQYEQAIHEYCRVTRQGKNSN